MNNQAIEILSPGSIVYSIIDFDNMLKIWRQVYFRFSSPC
jgi:hypothetical protein